MRLKIIPYSIVISFSLVLGIGAQDRTVTIQGFEVDHHVIRPNFSVLAYFQGHETKLNRVKNGFIIPASLADKVVSIRFVWNNYDLYFSPIYPSKFMTNWVIRIDKKPFDSALVPQSEMKGLREVHYLRFVSNVGDDTEIVVTIPKKNK